MLVAKKISVLVLKIGWCLLILAAFPKEDCCLELPDAPQPQQNALPGQDSHGQSTEKNGLNLLPNRQRPCPVNASDKDHQQNCESPRDPFRRFVIAGKSHPLTPEGKLYLAGRSVVDPFNLLTIGADAAIAVGSDAHSAYGPGMKGYGKYVGVSLTGDITGEFFGTFLIPSLAHQDPRYHRLPQASIPRRVGHAIVQVVWTKGDDGLNMPNYGTVFGIAAVDILGNLYVPGQHTGMGPTAQRWATGLASAPIDNFITEFVPDVARHINVRIVLFQRIMNGVARPDSQ